MILAENDVLQIVNRDFVNAGRVNYSLAISINDENEELLSELGQGIATLACENKSKTAKLSHQILSQLRRLPLVSIRMYTPGFT